MATPRQHEKLSIRATAFLCTTTHCLFLIAASSIYTSASTTASCGVSIYLVDYR